MLKINAASRLLVAEGEWFHALPEPLQKQYVEEHPDSKYAQGWKPKGEDEGNKAPESTEKNTEQSPQKQPQNTNPNPGPMQRLQRPPAQLVKPRPQLPKKTEQALKHVPKQVKNAVRNGGLKPGSKERKEIKDKLKSQTPGLARGLLKDTIGAGKGLASVYNIAIKGKPEKGDFKKAASLVGTILGSSLMAAAIGTTGPVGFLAFMALKHMAAPELWRLTQKAFHPPPEPDEYGYWADRDTWVPVSKKEWHAMSATDADRKYEEGEKLRKQKEKEAEGSWDNGKWKPKPRTAPDHPDNLKDNPKPRQHASLADQNDEEKQMTQLLNTILDYVSDGDIPKEAMEEAIYKMADSQISSDRIELERQEQLRKREDENEPD
jgi:hypothetical protein